MSDSSPLSLRPASEHTPLQDAIDHLGESGDGFALGVKADADGTVVEAEGTKTIGKGWSVSGAAGWMSSMGAAAWGKLKWTPGGAKSIVLLIAGLSLVACAPRAFKAEAPRPTPAQLAALLAAPVERKHGAKDPRPATFELRAPRVALWGNTIALTCFVPESLGSGSIRLALEGVQILGPRPLEHAQTTLMVPRVECGTWKATCQVAASGGSRYVEQDVEVRGGMCDGTR